MSREDKLQREDGSGSVAGKVFAFIGVTLVVLILAAMAAVFIITKGPSPAARAEFVRRTADSGLAFVTKMFVPGDEIEAILAGDEAEQPPAGDEAEQPPAGDEDADPAGSETPDEGAGTEPSETPEESDTAAESAAPSADGGETSGEGE